MDEPDKPDAGIDLLSDYEKVDSFDVARRGGRNNTGLIAAAVVVVVGIWLMAGRGGSDVTAEPDAVDPTAAPGQKASAAVSGGDGPDEPDPLPDRLDAAVSTQGIPEALLAAELYTAAPNAETLRNLYAVLGGFDGLLGASSEGAFDLVRFDPDNPNRLLASVRSSYGDTDNSQTNEVWLVGETNVDQQLWMPDTPHDFAHFNVDGSITLWVNEGTRDFSPRVATVWLNAREPLLTTSPMFASRFTATADGVFALTGDGDYYSTRETYVELVADQGDGIVVLDDGSEYGWIDNPVPEILVAYPIDGNGLTTVWDTSTLEVLPVHPLAGRPYVRAAVSGDRGRAVGVRGDGVMDVINMATGQIITSFGDVDVDRVDLPVVLDDNGTIAWTVENNGQLTVWWVGDSKPIGGVTTASGQSRWVSERYAPLTASVVAPGGRNAVLRIGPTLTTEGQWLFTDTDIASWVDRACDRGGRSLTPDEAERLGLTESLACIR